MNKRILLPFDFANQSIINVSWAKYYAKKTESKIYLLNVVEESSFFKKLFEDDDFEKQIIEKAKAKLEEFAKENFSDVEYEIMVKAGKVYEVIEQTADEIQPWAIIMGRDENPTLKKIILGSNTLHVINETDYPVISIRGENTAEKANSVILLPIDFLKNYTEQLSAAVEMAKLLKSKIFIVSVKNADSIADETQILVKLNKTKQFLEKENIEVEGELVEQEKDFYEIIDKYIEKLNPELVIIMLRDESIFGDFKIGSKAKEILEKSQAPVMSIKPWDATSEVNPIFQTIIDPLGIF